jgi:hypothetical protein
MRRGCEKANPWMQGSTQAAEFPARGIRGPANDRFWRRFAFSAIRGGFEFVGAL